MTREEFEFQKALAISDSIENTAKALIKSMDNGEDFINHFLIIEKGRADLVRILMQPRLKEKNENTLQANDQEPTSENV